MPVPYKIFKGSGDKSLQNIMVDVDIMLNKLNSLNVSKSQGQDEMLGKIVMGLREELASPLLNLFKASMETGLIPQDFRDVIVVPLL